MFYVFGSRPRGRRWCVVLVGAGLACLAAAAPRLADAAPDAGAAGLAAASGDLAAAACPLVDRAAQANEVPAGLLTRLIWAESRFRSDVTSPAGAQGIAQFMPQTAAQQELADPFDPEQAIPKAAQLLSQLHRQFGNFGLAAAAYNAGSARVAAWLAGTAALPAETQAYVFLLTGRPAADWAAAGLGDVAAAAGDTCVQVTASLRTDETTQQAAPAPWGVQLSGSFSKAAALAAFARAAQRYRGLLGELRPMVLGGVVRSRGRRPFYRVLIPEASRAQADQLCNAIIASGGACVALRS